MPKRKPVRKPGAAQRSSRRSERRRPQPGEPRPMWIGSISFGLVHVPVKLFGLVHHKEVHFNQLHEKDGSRIYEKRFCAAEDKEIPYEEVAKGYRKGRGRYVMIDPDDLERLDPKTTRRLELQDFVALDSIDPVYFEHPYYLAPDKEAEKAYALLVAALEQSGKVGIGRVTMRSRQYIVAVRAHAGVLSMVTLLYADEIMPPSALGIKKPSKRPTKSELKVALQLIDALATDFKPEKYRDTYRAKVLKFIEKKAGKKTVVAPLPAAEPIPVKDLMAALEKSLAEHKTKSTRPRRKPAHARSR
jgi:DNA end-binding protein Ku